MNQFAIFFTIFFVVFAVSVEAQEIVKDIDRNEYKTVKIGAQIWMAENLKVAHYCNSNVIPNISDTKQWNELTIGAYCDVANNPAKSDSLGRLYNWYVISDERNVCPSGWHIPDESEWQTLVKYLSELPNGKSINEKMFSLLQVNFRGFSGEFLGNGYGGGAWWSSSPATSETAYYHGINYNTVGKIRMECSKRFGYSIRCIKD